MESYVIRIYRRHEAEPERVIGLVEHPENGSVEKFSGTAELLNILLTPTKSAEAVVAPEEKERPAPTRAGKQCTDSETASTAHENTRTCAAGMPHKTDFHSSNPHNESTRVFFLAEARRMWKP